MKTPSCNSPSCLFVWRLFVLALIALICSPNVGQAAKRKPLVNTLGMPVRDAQGRGINYTREDGGLATGTSPTPTPPPHTPTPTPTAGPGATSLLNISTRLRVLTGDNALIGGFIVSGNVPKKVIVRAIGPSLTDFGIAGALANPVLELHGTDGFSTITNDNWKDSQESEIEATSLAPTNDFESAIVAMLSPGAYTAVVRGSDDGIGVGLVEAYDLDSAADSKLANISTRGFVDSGENAMIGGFILGGSDNASIMIRAIGPSLIPLGVPGALVDPTLELHNGNGDVIAANDNWKDTQQAEIEATGIPPGDDRESAIVSTLAPGSYTAIVRGKNDTTGVGLIEAYRLATPTPPPTPTPSPIPFAKFESLSSRGRVGSDPAFVVNAFIITGAFPKRVLLRGIGPSLAAAGVPDPLADPVLELHGPGGFVTITNDNWKDTQQAEIKATGIPPTNDLESAMLVTLDPGAYTVVLRGKNNITGTAINEIYDFSQIDPGNLTALGTRANVGQGNDILISEIVLTEGGNIVARFLGPSLSLSNLLADPVLELRDSNGVLILADDNWQDNPSQAAQVAAAGLAPENPLESAIAVNLAPDSYTFLASGRNGGTGMGYLQIYSLPWSGSFLP